MSGSNVMRLVIFIAAAGLLAGCSAGSGGGKGPTPLRNQGLPAAAVSQANVDSPLGRAVLRAVNTHRGGAGLTVQANLQQAAAVHATDMVQRSFWGHHNPDGQGPLDRVLVINPDFQGQVGENIWRGSRKAGLSDEAFAAVILQVWINSPGHRNLLEAARFKTTGIGVAETGGITYVVQVFAD